jgi:hypothetical protein
MLRYALHDRSGWFAQLLISHHEKSPVTNLATGLFCNSALFNNQLFDDHSHFRGQAQGVDAGRHVEQRQRVSDQAGG